MYKLVDIKPSGPYVRAIFRDDTGREEICLCNEQEASREYIQSQLDRLNAKYSKVVALAARLKSEMLGDQPDTNQPENENAETVDLDPDYCGDLDSALSGAVCEVGFDSGSPADTGLSLADGEPSNPSIA